MTRYSDRHEPVIGVVAFVPTFLDSGTIIGALPSESVTTSLFKIGFLPRPLLPKKKGNYASVAGIRLFGAHVR